MSRIFVGCRHEDARCIMEFRIGIPLANHYFLDFLSEIRCLSLRYQIVLNLFQYFFRLFSRLGRNANDGARIQYAPDDTEYCNEVRFTLRYVTPEAFYPPALAVRFPQAQRTFSPSYGWRTLLETFLLSYRSVSTRYGGVR